MSGLVVDVAARTISGPVVPYGPVVTHQRRRWRFAPGSVRYGSPGDVALNVDHVHSRRVGRAQTLASVAGVLTAVFLVYRGDPGDRVLAEADTRVLAGLSPGTDLIRVGPDPDVPGVQLVRRAWLREVSLTAAPAFDVAGAR
ncbi:hypothetical protein M3G91_10195 [Micromonospora chalcea]|uniref:hypothetical protein n=1 Tax=Micromonospora chalcea TaxID=1874 RepID=UPI0021A8B588|nr:hypothetical protein [Micromonospora chalcea]MCT2277995.1 hypothetical protein [Micromonospora chalcea]